MQGERSYQRTIFERKSRDDKGHVMKCLSFSISSAGKCVVLPVTHLQRKARQRLRGLLGWFTAELSAFIIRDFPGATNVAH
jgi:hypothetical protein